MDALDPVAAHYYCVGLARPADHYDELLAFMPPSAARILDAGCGSGQFTLRLAARAEAVVGLDLSPALIQLAQKGQGHAGTRNVEWVVGNVEHPPFQGAQFDFVVSANVLRLADLPVALGQLARLTKPGGRMAIQDLVAADLPPAVLVIRHLYQTLRWEPSYLRRFGPSMMLRITASRIHPKELRRIFWRRMRFEALEETYRRILPGCRLKVGRRGYVALWEKPPSIRG